MSVITIDHVSKQYGNVTVLNDFHDEFKDGEFITLLGPSGCGKTTMLRMLAGFEKPSSGEIRLDGKVVSSADTFVPPEKRGIGMVFQSYAVWPHMNVFDNVTYPLKIQKVSKAEIKERTERVLEAVHLSQYVSRMPSELSGGQQQRVALGRALVAQPKVLLLDEPLSNLDAKLRERMCFEIKEIQQRFGITVVYVTHDHNEAMTMSDRVFVINSGVVQQTGSPIDIYQHPANQFVADFVGKVNILKGISENGTIRLTGVDDVLSYNGPCTGPVDVMIRPENIRIVPGEAHLKAQMLREFFMGDFDDCRVRCGEKELRIITDVGIYGKYEPGSEVGLEITDFRVFPESSEDYTKILT